MRSRLHVCNAEAAAQRQRGTEAFKRGAFSEAAEAYGAALRLCPRDGGGAAASTLAALHANRAAALLRLGHAAAAERECSRALALDEVRKCARSSAVTSARG